MKFSAKFLLISTHLFSSSVGFVAKPTPIYFEQSQDTHLSNSLSSSSSEKLWSSLIIVEYVAAGYKRLKYTHSISHSHSQPTVTQTQQALSRSLRVCMCQFSFDSQKENFSAAQSNESKTYDDENVLLSYVYMTKQDGCFIK